MKNLATPSSIFIFISSSSTGDLCSQSISGNVHRIGRMFPEHVERSFLDPEVRSWTNTPNNIREAKVRPVRTSSDQLIFAEYSQVCSRTNIRQIKNGFKKLKTERKKTKRRLRTSVILPYLTVIYHGIVTSVVSRSVQSVSVQCYFEVRQDVCLHCDKSCSERTDMVLE